MKLQASKNKIEILLDKLVNDYGSGLPPHERVFKEKDVPAYIYNLYNGSYEFSYDDFKNLLKLIKEKSICKTDCSPS